MTNGIELGDREAEFATEDDMGIQKGQGETEFMSFNLEVNKFEIKSPKPCPIFYFAATWLRLLLLSYIERLPKPQNSLIER